MDTQDKKKYAIQYLEINLADLWETLLEFHAMSTYEEFISAVLTLYPGASEERKWSMIDVDTLIGECLHIGILMASDLAQYFCTYYMLCACISFIIFLINFPLPNLLSYLQL
jgi:hypothetical protein